MRREWQCSRINLPAADDEDVTVRQRQGVVQPVDYLGAFGVPLRIACDDDVPTPAERTELRWNGVPGAPPHDYRMAHGDALEVSHVLGHAPRDRVVGADDAAEGLRPDEGDCAIGHRQTATGALIAGWCW